MTFFSQFRPAEKRKLTFHLVTYSVHVLIFSSLEIYVLPQECWYIGRYNWAHGRGGSINKTVQSMPLTPRGLFLLHWMFWMNHVSCHLTASRKFPNGLKVQLKLLTLFPFWWVIESNCAWRFLSLSSSAVLWCQISTSTKALIIIISVCFEGFSQVLTESRHIVIRSYEHSFLISVWEYTHWASWRFLFSLFLVWQRKFWTRNNLITPWERNENREVRLFG